MYTSRLGSRTDASTSRGEAALHGVLRSCGLPVFYSCMCGSFMRLAGLGRHRGASRVCRCYFSRARLRARCRFCALFVLLFSFATTKMSGSIVIVHSALACLRLFRRYDFLESIPLHYNSTIRWFYRSVFALLELYSRFCRSRCKTWTLIVVYGV